MSSIIDDKYVAATIELISLMNKDGCKIETTNPNRDCPYGEYDPGLRMIRLFKNPRDILTGDHVFVLAHEYRHFKQHMEMMFPLTWLADLDIIEEDKECRRQNNKAEKDADEFAKAFCDQRGIDYTENVHPKGRKRKRHEN